MYKLTNIPTSRKISPKDAEEFLAINNFPGQRQLSVTKAKRYSDLLIQGRLRPVEIALATLRDGQKVLMNGQHVCTACLWANKDMMATVSFYKCETDRDAWELFATFDVHAPRTQTHVFNAARGLLNNEALREVPLSLLQSAGSALANVSVTPADFGYKLADKAEKVRLVEAHAQEVIWLANFRDCKRLSYVAVLSAMLSTYRKDPDAAERFWRKIHTGLGFKSNGEHEKQVFDFLNDIPSMNTRKRNEVIYATCVSWWNSWRNGEPRRSVKVAAMENMPEAI